jgi:hypothetical protein
MILKDHDNNAVAPQQQRVHSKRASVGGYSARPRRRRSPMKPDSGLKPAENPSGQWVHPRLPSAPDSLPPQPPIRPRLPSAPGSLPHQAPFRPRLLSAPDSHPPQHRQTGISRKPGFPRNFGRKFTSNSSWLRLLCNPIGRFQTTNAPTWRWGLS